MRLAQSVGSGEDVFQAHGADASGGGGLPQEAEADQLLAFFAGQPRCVVAMEACAGAHYWAREISGLGHDGPADPAGLRQAVREAAEERRRPMPRRSARRRSGPTMRFVAAKSAEAQAAAVVFRTRDLLVRQRTQMINALRGHLAEFGMVVRARASPHVEQARRAAVEDPATALPEAARPMLQVLVADAARRWTSRIRLLDVEIAQPRQGRTRSARRLMTIPGVGRRDGHGVRRLAPPAETFKRGRDFAAWLGLTPRQQSTGGKERLGRTSKMGTLDR